MKNVYGPVFQEKQMFPGWKNSINNQVLEQIEGSVTELISQNFSWNENNRCTFKISWVSSELTISGTTGKFLGASRNINGGNQELLEFVPQKNLILQLLTLKKNSSHNDDLA